MGPAVRVGEAVGLKPEGDGVGCGDSVGDEDGGLLEGLLEGDGVGSGDSVGDLEGNGDLVGLANVGFAVGAGVGITMGVEVGTSVGCKVGSGVVFVGATLGLGDGGGVGNGLGAPVGGGVGGGVGGDVGGATGIGALGRRVDPVSPGLFGPVDVGTEGALTVGFLVGFLVGAFVGVLVGFLVGALVGILVGVLVGFLVGVGTGLLVAGVTGLSVGLAVAFTGPLVLIPFPFEMQIGSAAFTGKVQSTVWSARPEKPLDKPPLKRPLILLAATSCTMAKAMNKFMLKC